MIFAKIKKFFQRNSQESENITDISEALTWLKTCQKTGDFNTAIIAAKELILKNQTGITYYENAKRKILVLENSNIETISLAAKEKHKKIDTILINLYKEVNNIEKVLVQIEKEYLEKRDKEEVIEKKLKFKLLTKDLNELFRKKEYTDALILAKKLLSDFHNEK
jgi:hypothetical protein